MKGLLIKDLKLLKAQKYFLLVVLGVGILFLVRGEEMAYVFAYLSAIYSMLVVSTIGYDQMDNGMNFIFTFPVSREKYVLAKYVFGILLTVCLEVFFSVSVLAVGAVNSFSYSSQQYLIGVLGILLAAIGIISIMVPLQLKFGAEKSRIVLMIFLGVSALAVYAVRQAAEVLHVDLTPVTERIRQAGPVETAVCLSVLAVGLLGISYMVSVAVMRRKQF